MLLYAQRCTEKKQNTVVEKNQPKFLDGKTNL